MKEKIRWIGILLVLLLCVFGMARWIEKSMICGVQVVSTEKLISLTEGMEYIAIPENMEELIYFEGQMIPYNQKQNTFYVSQNMDTPVFEGSFTIPGENCSIYMEKDEWIEDKSKAVREGHQFKLWIVAEQEYATVNLVFTGLPILNLQMESELSEEESPCKFILQSPYDEEVKQYSIKTSESMLKVKRSSGTLSFKLYEKDYEDGKKLNLLDMGKYASWKLYPVTGKNRNPVGLMLSSYVWNTVCEINGESDLQRKFGMVEVFVNGEYYGLFCMAPKVTESYLNLTEKDSLYRIEEKENIMYDVLSNNEKVAGNIYDYNFFLQVTGSIQNGEEDFFVIYNESEGCFDRMPAKYTYCFGEFPEEQGYLSMEAEKYIVPDELLATCAQDDPASWELEITEKWSALRQSGLTTESLLMQAQEYQQLLDESGYLVRSGNAEEYVYRYEQLQQYVTKRMDYLDIYFGIRDGK